MIVIMCSLEHMALSYLKKLELLISLDFTEYICLLA